MENNDKNIDELFKSNLENRNFHLDDNHLENFENQLNEFNKRKNIDELFKTKLNKREFYLDDKHLGNLEQQLDQLKKFKSKYWYSAAAALLLLISSLLYINYYENEPIVNSSTKQLSSKNLSTNNENLVVSRSNANNVKRSESISPIKTNQKSSKIDQPKNSNSKTKKTLETSSKKEVLNTFSKSSTSLDIPTSKIAVVSKKTNLLVKDKNLEDIEDKIAELALNYPKSNSILTDEKEIINDIIKDSANNNLINPLVIDSSDGFNAINDTSLKELSDTLENVVSFKRFYSEST